MAISLSLAKLADIVGGEVLAPEGTVSDKVTFLGLEYDSREIKGGELFVALKGLTTHGHEFLTKAFERGASTALIEDAAERSKAPHRNFVVVKDSLKAFSMLARWWRRELKIPVFAITGSVGKTSVKELAACILLKAGRGGFSLKSFNNQVGVPYTLCRLSREHAWAVSEMGMNHAGELSHLSRIAEPDVAAITVIAPAHIEFFSSLEEIAKAKLEIIEGLAPGYPLILNADDSVLNAEASLVLSPGRVNALSFGTQEGATCRLSEFKSLGLEGISFALELKGEKENIHMKTLGFPFAMNAACAALGAKTLFPDLPLGDIAEALGRFTAPLMRVHPQELNDGRLLIDDSYNANPTSMQAFLDLAKELQAQGKKVGLIVGDMLELGKESDHYHDKIGQSIADLAPSFVLALGAQADRLIGPARERQIHAEKPENPEAAGHIAAGLSFDILMVKASRGIGLDRAVKAIHAVLLAPV